ncbi:MAG: hypothetical protein KatS3mg111_0297 [Pirellulaceae bacterium]|nr:MAG: hypothetical protein KatS3mg111_0297 [Pirellulaceae bacterium]
MSESNGKVSLRAECGEDGAAFVVAEYGGRVLRRERCDLASTSDRERVADLLIAEVPALEAIRDDLIARIGRLRLLNGQTRPESRAVVRPKLVCLADIEPRAVRWLWRNRIPAGRVTLLVGIPGAGKSFLTCDMAARISTGTPWPDASECERGSVLLMTAEDDPHDTIRPRLDAHRADVSRVHLLAGGLIGDDANERTVMVTLGDVDVLREAVERVGDCRLIVIDPIGSFLGGRTDAHRDNEVRSVLAPVVQLAEETGAAVLVVAHRRKGTAGSADDSALGSRAFTGLARAVWHVSADAENEHRRLLLPGKCNVAARQSGLAYRIEGEPARLVWESEPVEMTADEALAAQAEAGANGGGVADAVEWLGQRLSDGPKPAKDMIDEWTNGEGGSKRTLDRARKRLRVDAYRPEIPGPWWWRLTDEATRNIANNVTGNLGNLAENPRKTPTLPTLPTKDLATLESDEWGEV